MGEVKKKPLPTPDTNPVDGDKLIEATKPKKVKKSDYNLDEIVADIDKLGNWIADIDDDIAEMNKLLIKIANRMGLK